jgi:uncharacterized protein
MWETRPELPDGAPPPPERAEQAWRPWTAPVALVSALLVAFVGGLIVALIGAAVGNSRLDDTPPGVLMTATFIQDVGFVAAAVLFASMTGRTWAAQFGLRRVRVLPAIGWMLVLYVGFIAFSGLWQQVVDIDEDTELLRDLGVEDSTLALVAAMLMVCVVAPVVEEFFFRGFFFTALRNWKGLWPAAVATGAVFGAIHVGSSPVGALVPLAVLGFGLCLLYAKTGSLYPCIAVHALNNAIAFGTLNDWTWQIPLLTAGALAASLLVTVPVVRRWRPPPPAAEPRLEPAPGPMPA